MSKCWSLYGYSKITMDMYEMRITKLQRLPFFVMSFWLPLLGKSDCGPTYLAQGYFLEQIGLCCVHIIL
uniref:Uncharacterized protein n=1 Tax=Rhizophora mucronata TaxID=61149 RepID=A0A2P2N8T4_RHIMU